MIQRFVFSRWQNVSASELSPGEIIRVFNKDGSKWVDKGNRDMWTVKSVVKTQDGYRIYRY